MKEKFVNHSIGDLCISLNGLWKGKKEPFVNVGVIRNANFTKDFKLDYSKIEFIDVEKRLFEKRNLQNGDLIIEKSGGSDKNPVGRAILYEGESGRYSYSNFTSVLRIKEKKILSSKYLYNYILYRYKQGDMGSMQSNTTGIHNLDYEKYLAIQIPVPSLPEQERIVKILDAAFEKIDRLKKNAEEGLQAVKDLWEATVTRIFSNLNDTIKLSNVAKISSGFAFKSNVFKKDGKYQILRIGNVKQGKVLYNSSPIFIDEMNSAELKKAELLINDLVITQTGTKNKRDYGFVSLIQRKNLLLNQRVAKVRVVDPNFLPKFFLYYSYTENYKTQYFSNEGGTVGQGNVGISALTDMLVPYPDIEEQKKVVETLDKIQNICQNIQSKYEQELSEYEALKQSILRKAFSGEL